MKKRDIQASVLSVFLHASLLGGLTFMNVKHQTPQKPKMPTEIEFVTLDVDKLPEMQKSETDTPTPDPIPRPKTRPDVAPRPKPVVSKPTPPRPAPPQRFTPQPPRVTPPAPRPRPVQPSRPVQAPVIRTPQRTPDRIPTPQAPVNPPRTAPPPTRPTVPTAPRNTEPNVPQPPRPQPPAPRPQPPAPRPTAPTNTNGNGARGDADDTPSSRGDNAEPRGRPSSGASLIGLNRTIVRRSVPRATELVNSVIDICITVSPSGGVVSKSVCKKGNAALESSSLSAVSGWRFNALPDGAPQVNQSGRIRFRFVVN